MNKLLLLALVLPACVVGEGGTTPGDPNPDPGPGPGSGSGISGRISTDTVLSGAVAVTGQTTIDPGVTVTVMPGAIVTFTAASNLAIQGTLDVQGTKGSEVQLIPESTNFWGGLNVSGTLRMSYGIQHGGGIVTNAGGSATITDSKMFGAVGDFLVMNGGTVNVTYSQLGADAGTTDTTHCNMHFGGAGNMISVTHSNIEGTAYGLMFYGGQSAVFTNNNWEENAMAAASWIDSQSGVSGDFSNGFFSGGPPTAVGGATLTVNTPSATRLTDAGVR